MTHRDLAFLNAVSQPIGERGTVPFCFADCAKGDSPQSVFKLLLAIGATAIGVLVCASACATTYYWDTNGTSSGIGSGGGGAADWLTDSWATGSSGTLPTAAWPNTQPVNDDEAVFMGTAGTVNVDTDVYVNALTFETNGYTIGSTGGALHLVGTNPTITVDLPSNNNTTTISAPILGDNGFLLTGNTSLASGLKFLVLANASGANPNAFAGTLTIDTGGALRLGGGTANEQIPDDVDLEISGVIDFITSGGASDGKQEQVRDVNVSGAEAIFSVGNGSDFIVNSMEGSSTGNGPGISVNGNNASVPGTLSITGWADGEGHLTLDDSRVRVNTTGAQSAIGGRVLLSGNLTSSGDSEVSNANGGNTPDDNNFTHKAFDFTSAAHTINVTDGTLTFTSRTAVHPLEVTSTNPGGTTLTKTGAGIWLWEDAVESSFTGVNRLEAGTWRLGASERLADASQLEVAGGDFDLQGNSETVAAIVLSGGAITGTGAAKLTGTSFDARDGFVDARLAGSMAFTKSTTGKVTLAGSNTYSGTTSVEDGTLIVNGTHTGGGTYTIDVGATLGGTGSIDSPVVVEGSVAPGESIGTLSVSNDVTFSTGSQFDVELDGATSDLLAVIGNLDLSALDNSLLVSGAGTGDTWTIATYTGQLTGEFESITAGYEAVYGSGMIQLNKVGEGCIDGDFSCNGAVENADLTLLLNNWAQAVPPTPAGWVGTAPTSPAIDNDELTLLLNNWGQTAGGGAASSSAVPEPTSIGLAVLALAMLARAGRRGS